MDRKIVGVKNMKLSKWTVYMLIDPWKKFKEISIGNYYLSSILDDTRLNLSEAMILRESRKCNPEWEAIRGEKERLMRWDKNRKRFFGFTIITIITSSSSWCDWVTFVVLPDGKEGNKRTSNDEGRRDRLSFLAWYTPSFLPVSRFHRQQLFFITFCCYRFTLGNCFLFLCFRCHRHLPFGRSTPLDE